MRVENWPAALAAEIASAQNKPFAWGSHDCGTFAAAVETAVTGETGFGDALGGYKTAIGAARKLRKIGFATIEDLVAARLVEITPSFAQRGDVVAIDTDLGPAIGVVTGADALTPGLEGLVRYPVTVARRAWRVD